MKQKKVENKFNELTISLQHVENAIINSSLAVGGSLQIGNNYYDTPELFTPPALPFERPDPHIPRRIFKEKDAGNMGLFGGRENFDLLAELEKHPRIALLGDAGMGKSTELEWICHELKDRGQYFPIYRKLNSYKSSGVYLDDIDKFGREHECSIVLVLDGLDEPDMTPAKEAIEKFANNFPNAKILVSCRSNAYADSLTGFEPFQLGKLNYLDIEGYIMKVLGHSGQAFLDYWRQKYAWNENQLIDNPFFLVRICEFVQGNNNRPPGSLGEMFEYLIEKSLDLRLKSISRFGIGNYETLRQSCRQSLEKLAFVMECKGDNVISETEFTILIPSTDEQEILLAKSSLLEQQGTAWRFAHNNFQEYLAAKALSRANNFEAIKKTIAAKPDYQRLKWTWVNSLSFLLGLWEEGNLMKSQLLNWLTKEDLAPLIKIISLEKERISPNDRERIFRAEFEKCKKEGLVVGSHHYRYWDMASFGESPETFRYLMEELRTATTPVVKGNALVLLKAMQGHFIFGETKASLKDLLLQNIYDLEGNTPENRRYSMEALFRLFDDLTKAEVVKLVEIFFDSGEGRERVLIYSLIEKFNLQTHFIHQILERIRDLDDYNWRKGKMRHHDEDSELEDCLKGVHGEEILVVFFENYPLIVKDKWESKQKSLNSMLQKLADETLSPEAIFRIFNAMKLRFAEWLGSPVQVKRDLIIRFLEKNNLQFYFYQFCLDNGRMIDVSTLFLDEEGIDYLVQEISEGRIERPWAEKYVFYAGFYKEKLLPTLVERLNKVVDKPFLMPHIKPPIDYDAREQLEKSLFFDKKKCLTLIEQIFEEFGKECFAEGEIYDLIKTRFKEDSEDFWDNYPHILVQLIDEQFLKTKTELINDLYEHWEYFFIRGLKSFLASNQKSFETKPELDLTEGERQIVKQWCESRFQKIEWNGKLTEADIAFCWFTLRYDFNDFPENVYLQMVGSELGNHIETELNIIEFVEKQTNVPLEKLRERVLDNLRKGWVKGSEVVSHLEFVENHQLQQAIPILRRYIEGEFKSSDFCKNFALKVYIKLNVGQPDYLHQRFKEVSEETQEKTLLEYFSKSGDIEFEQTLLQKLTTSTVPEQKATYARYLMRLGNLDGLRFLEGYIEQEKKSPFSAHVGNPDYQFENPKGIYLLLRFFDYGNDTSIVQDNFDRISSAGHNMLLHLAACQNRRFFPAVIKAVKWHLRKHEWQSRLPVWLKKYFHVSRQESLKQLRYLLKDLEFNHYQKQPVDIEEAVETWEKLS